MQTLQNLGYPLIFKPEILRLSLAQSLGLTGLNLSRCTLKH